jgi:DNA polymerase I-like protein with 3'-5' exonuclease and polymerase domains
MSTDFEPIDWLAIRALIPLADYCTARGIELEPNGSPGLLVGLCPFHDENTPSFTIYPDNTFYCFGCERYGDITDVDQVYCGGTLVEAALRLCGGRPPTGSSSNPRPTTTRPVSIYLPTAADHERMLEASMQLLTNPELALQVRGGLPLAAVEQLAGEGSIGFCEDLHFGDYSGPALLFGYPNGIKARWFTSPGEKKRIRWLCGGAHHQCWRQHLLTPAHQEINFAEGEPDALALIAAGFEIPGQSLVLGLANSTSIPDPSHFIDKDLILYPDADLAGRKCAERFRAQLLPRARSVTIVTLDRPRPVEIEVRKPAEQISSSNGAAASTPASEADQDEKAAPWVSKIVWADCVAVDVESVGKQRISKRGKPLANDLETDKNNDALSPERGRTRLLTYMTADMNEPRTIDLFAGPIPPDVVDLLKTKIWIAHNAKFEVRFLAKHLDGFIPAKVFCTQTAARLLSNGGPKNTRNDLKATAARYLGVTLKKGLGTSWWGAQSLSAEQIQYAIEDVIHLFALAKKLEQCLHEADLWWVFSTLETPLIPVVADMEAFGVKVDQDKLRARRDDLTSLVAKTRAIAEAALGDNPPLLTSPKVLLPRLQELGIEVDGKPIPDTQRITLEASGHDVALAIVDFKHAHSRLTKANELLRVIDQTGTIHANFNPVGARTGRFSCAQPNLQNLPKVHDLFRDCVIASGPGRLLVGADFSNIELRVAAYYSLDAIMVQAFLDEKDLHEITFRALHGKPADTKVSKEERQQGKPFNFGAIYGMGPKKLRIYARSYGVKLTDLEAERFLALYFERYPGIKEWHETAWKEGRARLKSRQSGESRTIGHRRLLVPTATMARTDIVWRWFKALINFKVQGSAGDLMKLTMLLVAAALPAGAQLILTVHDEIICDVDASQAEEVQVIIERCMKEAWAHYFGDVVPVEVESKICKNWQEGK